MSSIHCPTPPPTKLHVGDHMVAAGYSVDPEVMAITDHTTDSIGQIVYELRGDDDHTWFLIGGIAIQGGVR